MALLLAYNTTGAPVQADDLGHLIGGREWGVVNSTDPVSKDGLASGALVLVDEKGASHSDNPLVKAGLAHLADRREREAAAKALSKDELADRLEDAGADADGPVAELRDEAAANPDVDLKPTTRSRGAKK